MIRTTTFWLATCIACTSASLDKHLVIKLFPAGAPGEVKDWPGPEASVNPYGFPGITNVSIPTLEVFIAQNSSGAGVIIAPGGGYKYLEYQKEGRDIALRMNALGVNAFVLKYRVPLVDDNGLHNRSAAPLQDAQRAMGLVRSKAVEFGIDISKLGFIGFSAGGDLTSLISNKWHAREYARIDAADDLSCRPDFSLMIYPGTRGNVSPRNPPTFVAQAADDTEVDPQQTLAYYSRLLANGVPSPTLHMYPKGGHGFAVCQGFPHGSMRSFEECCEWPTHALRFMQDNGFVPGFPSGEQMYLTVI